MAATARHGKGTVTIVGFSSLFVDARMGATGHVIPDERLKAVFDLQFTLIRAILADDPVLEQGR